MTQRNFFLICAIPLLVFTSQNSFADSLTQFNLDLKFDFKALPELGWKEVEEKALYSNADGYGLKYSVLEVKQERARQILKNKLIQLKMLFAPEAAAYPGMITKGQDCAKRAALAQKTEENKSSYFWFSEMPATEEGQVGTCGLRPETKWAHRLVIYCKKSGKLYEVELVKPMVGSNLNSKKPIAECI